MAYEIVGSQTVPYTGEQPRTIFNYLCETNPTSDQLPTTDDVMGSMAHTAGYEHIWELAYGAWTEV
ncbi:hypothetical protein AGMMS49975_28390 [Clostridia bacterium]|nr:hypothetical protein AGMMS49975_28390 [Clostridia bacterium]